MTNKEASDELFDLMISGEITKKNLALKMAIKALEQQSCEDCISRQTAIEAMGEQPLNWTDTPEEIAEEQMWQDHIKALKELPSVTPARAKGEWISETCIRCFQDFCLKR